MVPSWLAIASMVLGVEPRRLFGVALEHDACPAWMATPEQAGRGVASRADLAAALEAAADHIRAVYDFTPFPCWELLRPRPAFRIGGVPTLYDLGVLGVQEVASTLQFDRAAVVASNLIDPDRDGYPEYISFTWPEGYEPPARFLLCVPDGYRTDGTSGFSPDWCVAGYPEGLTEIPLIPSYLCVDPVHYVSQRGGLDGTDPSIYLPELEVYGMSVSTLRAERNYLTRACEEPVWVRHGVPEAISAAVKLAVALLEPNICDCDFVRSRAQTWRASVFDQDIAKEFPPVAALYSPFGVDRVGAHFAKNELEVLRWQLTL